MAEDKDKYENSEAVSRATNQVLELGLPLPGKPGEEELEWPENVATLSSHDLAHHISYWTAWASYSRWHLARVETDETAFEETYKRCQDKLIANSKNDRRTVTELKASVSGDPDLVKFKKQLLRASALKKMLASLLDGYEKKYATISREISRREAEIKGLSRTM